MGGVFIARETAASERTPALYRLPLLGWLFKRETNAGRQQGTADLHHTTHSEGLRSMNRAQLSTHVSAGKQSGAGKSDAWRA